MKKGVAILAAALCILGCAAGCSRKISEEEDVYVDLSAYYMVENENQYAVVVEGETSGTALKIEDEIYIPQEITVSDIDSKFFLDKENNQIRYTTPDEVIIEEVNGTSKNAIIYNEEVYLKLSYVIANSKANFEIIDNPNRIVVFTEFGDNIDACLATEDIKLRESASENANIMVDISKEDILIVKESGDQWYTVFTQNGVPGYVKADQITETVISRKPENEQPVYTHLTQDSKICLGWHLMTNQAGNDAIESKIANADGLNVISPTWFTVISESGDISSYASKAYVETAHRNGLQVWALINDFQTNEENEYYILGALSSTESRANLIDNLIEQVEEYNIDGINVDFENISLNYGRAYVQFIRELSIQCRKKGIVLSADLYVPMSFNQYYGRADIGEVLDYMIIMGYDEHWAGCGSAGSVASISYVRNGIVNTIKDVEPSRVINAIPFYTRIWSETPADSGATEGTYVEDVINGDYYLTSKAVGMGNAENAVASNNVEPYWLEDVGQYYAEYKAGEVLNRVWLEEERSIELKLQVMDEAKLGGVACWQLGLEKNEIWQVIKNYLED